MPSVSFSEKVCVVTGAASGLGRELCVQLARAGAKIVAADINEQRLAETLAGVKESGGEAKAVLTDVTAPDAVGALIGGAASEFGRLDFLFNNAGIAIGGEIRDQTLDHWRKVLDVNLLGAIHGIHHVYPIMARQGFGHIVNIASVAGLVAFPMAAPYSASKFALVGVSRALAMEARAFGVAVTIACPGFIDTPIVASPNVNADRQEVAKMIASRLGLVPVERAARLILAGVARRKRMIVFPGYARLLVLLDHISPALSDWAMQEFVRGFRAIRREPAA
jgi:NAD(P)-dependent dehydrogenase (short-subunit alcohol dehydrogenase family)